MEAWRRLRRLVDVYRHVQHYLDEVKYIEQALGYFPEADLQKLIMSYGKEALVKLQVTVQARGADPLDRPGLLVGNHISYVDMPLLMSMAPVSFVAKHEVRRFPILGTGAERAGTVFVKRNRKHSRIDAGLEVANSVLNKRRRVVIFPAGTTTIDERRPWRWGPFRIAAEHDLWLQPFRLRYAPLDKVAYINRDFFPVHLWCLLTPTKIQAELEFADPIKVSMSTIEEEAQRWWQWSRAFLPQVTESQAPEDTFSKNRLLSNQQPLSDHE